MFKHLLKQVLLSKGILSVCKRLAAACITFPSALITLQRVKH